MFVEVTACVSVNDVPLKGTTYLRWAQISSFLNGTCSFVKVFSEALHTAVLFNLTGQQQHKCHHCITTPGC